MFKVLIADDERTIRKGIISMLQKGFSGEIMCIETGGGKDALDLIHKENPQLIIADIRMPQMNGIDLIRTLRQERNEVSVILISGYEDFGFAIQAMSLGVKEYILKPIKREKFIQVVRAEQMRLEEESIKIKQELEKAEQEKKILSALKNKFFLTLLKAANQEEVKSQCIKSLTSMHIDLNHSLLSCAVIEYEITLENKAYIGQIVEKILDDLTEINSENGFFLHLSYALGKHACIFAHTTKNELEAHQSRIIKMATRRIIKSGKCRAYAGIGTVVHDIRNISSSMQHALYASLYKIFEDANLISHFKENTYFLEELLKSTALDPDSLFYFPNNSLDSNDVFYFHRKYAKITSSIDKQKLLVNLYKDFEWLQKKAKKSFSESANNTTIFKDFDTYWSVDAILQEMKRYLENIKTQNKNLSGNQMLFEQIVSFVNEKITEELDLQVVASAFNISTGYASRLFIKKNGIGFNEYLNKKRIEIAKKLLVTTFVPIYEISQLCGFQNPKYFSIVFKKNTGLSPSTFRAQAIAGKLNN